MDGSCCSTLGTAADATDAAAKSAIRRIPLPVRCTAWRRPRRLRLGDRIGLDMRLSKLQGPASGVLRSPGRSVVMHKGGIGAKGSAQRCEGRGATDCGRTVTRLRNT
jgi:hypothetical protein